MTLCVSAAERRGLLPQAPHTASRSSSESTPNRPSSSVRVRQIPSSYPVSLALVVLFMYIRIHMYVSISPFLSAIPGVL